MSNSKEIYGKGYTYTITRRFLDKATGRMRVRVTAYKGLLTVPDRQVWTDFHDFDDMHDGDAAYAKQIKNITDWCTS